MLTSPSARRHVPVRLCDLPENVVKPRYYVHEAHGYMISGHNKKRGGQDRGTPTAFYVYDSDDCHRAVGAFPSQDPWPASARNIERNRLAALALAARLNAEDKAEAA